MEESTFYQPPFQQQKHVDEFPAPVGGTDPSSIMEEVDVVPVDDVNLMSQEDDGKPTACEEVRLANKLSPLFVSTAMSVIEIPVVIGNEEQTELCTSRVAGGGANDSAEESTPSVQLSADGTEMSILNH